MPPSSSVGYLTSSMNQVADAVVIARYLRATLVLPDIRGSVPGQKRYAIPKFKIFQVFSSSESRYV